MVKTVEAWDNPDFAGGTRTPADHRDVEFRIGDVVHVTFDLTDKHLTELVEHNAKWIAWGDEPPPAEVLAAVRGTRPAAATGGQRGSSEARAYKREVRHFAEGTGRGRLLIRPGWEPADGSKNKYQYLPEIVDDHAAWVAAGRPPLETWLADRGGP